MAKNSIWDYSTTPGSNTDMAGTDISGATGKVKDGDNALRSLMEHSKEFALDLGAVNTVGGTGDAITVTLSGSPTAYVDGLFFKFTAGAANTGATTITVTPNGGSALASKKVRKISGGTDAALAANDIVAGGFYELIYDSAADSAAGAFILVNPAIPGQASTTEALTGTDSAKSVTPDALAALWEKGSAVASAATVSLGEGGFFHITGTTTITDIDFATAKDGRMAWLEFDDALTITHNATTLDLPGDADITTVAGDRMLVVQDSTDNVHVLAYQRADALGAPLLHVRDEKASGTQGGSFTGGAWATRDLNTASTNEITGASLASNQITLPAGTYDIEASCPGIALNTQKAQIYNTTDAATTLIGESSYADSAANHAIRCNVRGRFTLAGTKVLELRHYGQTSKATNGLGIANSITGFVEVYADVRIWKVA
jgi:hypothetical protein